jgi:hypothetical protein
LQVSLAIVNCCDLDIGCADLHNDGDAEADFCEVVRGQPSSEFADNDDERIVKCLEHVRLIGLL